ncbi:hypothetical protein F506_17255 [Herbaspirillum hiltneri N3]|uniref:Uncharacterized protein n=1 Tax=Herbaspirillum hiltneri N3 TaxID=1262470 RepID=A0ABN4HZH0_9BURK|nr:hypothetical protein F506_17255 [Herbaspirillum hiltneri N3]
MFLSEARHLGTILQISFLNTTNIKNRFTLRENVCIWPIAAVHYVKLPSSRQYFYSPDSTVLILTFCCQLTIL